ncbi:MAG: outer membrane beta-barrel protein [Sphingomicrobium sp.]
MNLSRWLSCSALVGVMLLPLPAFAQQPEAGSAAASDKPGGRSTSYDAAYFAQYAPRSALDIVRRIPGFSLELGNTDLRGFSGAAGNVVLDGQRSSSKSESLETLLGRIPASRVTRVDVGPGDLFGADYSSKAQVANIILSTGGGMAGNASISGTRWFTGEIVPNGSASISLSRGPSTFSLSADAARNDQFEEGFDLVTDAASGAFLTKRLKTNDITVRDPYLSGSWALEQGDNRALHLNARFSPSRFRLVQANHVIPATGAEHDDVLHQDYRTDIFEIGGDISRPLAGGGLKFVGLANRRSRKTYDDYLARDLGGKTILGGFIQNSKSKYAETIGKLSWSRGDVLGFSFEAGGEIAFNKLDYALDLSELGPGGTETPILLPLEDATVSEARGEFYVNAGRELTKGLRLDGALNYEISRLKVRGDATADRSLKFLKPSLTLDWQPGSDWHLQMIARRLVAQLDFYDFVSAAELSSDRVSGGNANLVPQRTWEGRFVAEHPLLGKGKARLELGYDLVDQLQDRVLIYDSKGNAFDSPGNLGTGRRMFASLNLDAPLDKLWKGLRLSGNVTIQKTRVKDPITGQNRLWSDFFPAWNWYVEARRDAGSFAYGAAISDRRRTFGFRTDEVEAFYNGQPYATAFVEYRPSKSSTVTFNVENMFDTSGLRDRAIYTPNRTSPEPDVLEHRYRNSHVRLGLTYKMSFGSSGKNNPQPVLAASNVP